MKLIDEFMARARGLRDSLEARAFGGGKKGGLGALLQPAYSRPEILRIFDPIIALSAGIALVSASALGFAAFGVLVACALIAYLIITQVFGLSVELNPEMFQKFTQ